jgi:hypothetical protein
MNDLVRMLIGPGVPGPARVSYLPRLWLRSCLRGLDLLSPDHTDADARFEGTLATLAGNNDLSALADGLPTYVQFETRFFQSVGPLSDERIAAFDDAIAAVQLDSVEAEEIRARVGLENPEERNARLLVDLETWSHLHDIATSSTGDTIVPAISSTSTGPLGATHLPRMWAKALLTATDHIPPGYNSGAGGGDTFTVTRLGLDMNECIAKIAADRPTYLQYEAWVRSAGKYVDAVTIAQYNADAALRDKPAEMAEEIRQVTGITDAALSRTVILNDLEDWHALHASLTELSRVARGAR